MVADKWFLFQMNELDVPVQGVLLAKLLCAGRVSGTSELFLGPVVCLFVLFETCGCVECFAAVWMVAWIVAHVFVPGLDVMLQVAVAQERLVAAVVGADEWTFVGVRALVLSQADRADVCLSTARKVTHELLLSRTSGRLAAGGGRLGRGARSRASCLGFRHVFVGRAVWTAVATAICRVSGYTHEVKRGRRTIGLRITLGPGFFGLDGCAAILGSALQACCGGCHFCRVGRHCTQDKRLVQPMRPDASRNGRNGRNGRNSRKQEWASEQDTDSESKSLCFVPVNPGFFYCRAPKVSRDGTARSPPSMIAAAAEWNLHGAFGAFARPRPRPRPRL